MALIELDRPREVRFDFNAIADIEEMAGKSIAVLLSEENLGFNTIRLLMWAGLKHDDEKLSKQQVGTMIFEWLKKGGTMEKIISILSKAFDESGILGN